MTHRQHLGARPLLGRAVSTLDRRPHGWLLIGAGLLVASQMRFGIGVLAFIAPVPWIRHARITRGLRARAAFLLSAYAAWTLATAKIVTEPIPLVFAALFALPVTLSLSAPHLLVPGIRCAFGERAAIVAFGALMVVSEWILHALFPFGTWGSAANTQLERLALLQVASITGMHGVSLLVYLVAASVESLLDAPTAPRARMALSVAVLVVAAVVFGEARLARSSATGTERVRVAAVGTDSTIGAGPIPSEEELARVEEGLFERTRKAARAGAALVVWTEAATLVHPEDEGSFHARVARLAAELEVTVVAGYVVPRSTEPLRYANRYALFTPEGALDHVYDKHRPVPGEPAEAGKGPLPLHARRELGRLSGAICYDYDFPRLALEHARLDVDIVALPSSDWRGIDPIHTQMAALRAIEGGHSIVRSARYGLSAVIGPEGRLLGRLSHWDDDERVLVASAPRHGRRTLYAVFGDWFPLGSALVGFALAFGAFARGGRWYRVASWRTPSSPSRAAPSSKPARDSASTRTRC